VTGGAALAAPPVHGHVDARFVISFLGRTAASFVVVVSVAVLLLIGLLPRTGWYRTMTVLTGSMRPTFAPGDVVVARQTHADSVQVGDVLVYRVPVGARQVESHRIVQILGRNPLVIRTKGDANQTADPWTAIVDDNRVWTVRGAVPWVGRAILWLRTPQLHAITTYLLPLLVAMLLLSAIWRRNDEPEPVLDLDVLHRR